MFYFSFKNNSQKPSLYNLTKNSYNKIKITDIWKRIEVKTKWIEVYLVLKGGNELQSFVWMTAV